jgi:hypothetical protein
MLARGFSGGSFQTQKVLARKFTGVAAAIPHSEDRR